MKMWKFLDSGGRAVLSGFQWPLPPPGQVGPWVDPGTADPCRTGVHACRPSDLAWWLHEELWEVELAGDVVKRTHKVVGPRGRLVRRIEAWSAGAARELRAACAWSARDHALGVLADLGADIAAEPLRQAGSLEVLQEAGHRLATALGELTPVGLAVALAGDAAYYAGTGDLCHAPYIAACAAGHAASVGSGSYRDAFVAERTRQSEWITTRLELEAPPANPTAPGSAD